jgi:tetratricopeptide (TPR) repeat protein
MLRFTLMVLFTSPSIQGAPKPDLKSYRFSQDFSIKPETRDIPQNIFWRYHFGPLPTLSFPLYSNIDDEKLEVPLTYGQGEDIAALNLGRKYYLSQNLNRALKVWEDLRKKKKNTFQYHRRLDYFLGLAFLESSTKNSKHLEQAAESLTQALIHKKEIFDPIFEQVSSKQYYNLAIIYQQLGRKKEAQRSLESGLHFLRAKGGQDYRPRILRMLAEMKIQNEDYEDAVHYFKRSFQMDLTEDLAATIIARMGDIFFTLNHFELAERNYAFANTLDLNLGAINPHQHVLYAESLFWLGKFNDSIRHFRYGLDSASQANIKHPLPELYASSAALRIADAYMAQGDFKQARIAYDTYLRQFPNDAKKSVAQVRLACLELPVFDGENIPHARNLLTKLQANAAVGSPTHQLAHACEVSSYAQRERTPQMIERVKTFFSQYPSSLFLAELVEPVRETKASYLDGMFENPHKATLYFETYRKTLFKDLSQEQKQKLFFAYVDIHESKKAKEFWPIVKNLSPSESQHMKILVFLEETKADNNAKTNFIKLALERKWSIAFNDQHLNLRLLHSSQGDAHLDWLYQRASALYRSNVEEICNRVYPLVAAMKPESSLRIKALSTQLETHFPSILNTQEACGISFLDLEIHSYDTKIQELAFQYRQNRLNWPLSKALATIIWEVAERCAKKGLKSDAEELWRTIIEKAPQGTPERSFARIRLEKTRTELENLWE